MFRMSSLMVRANLDSACASSGKDPDVSDVLFWSVKCLFGMRTLLEPHFIGSGLHVHVGAVAV